MNVSAVLDSTCTQLYNFKSTLTQNENATRL